MKTFLKCLVVLAITIAAATLPVLLVQHACGINGNDSNFALAAGVWGILVGCFGGLGLFAVTDGF